MGPRSINWYEILARREAQHDYAAPDDLCLQLKHTEGDVRLPPATLPYCADLARERMLFTQHDEAGLQTLRRAPFMFGPQLETATGAGSVPFERLEALGLPLAPPPLLIFSPGRTGSTLMMRLLSAAGLPCASEPDMLTQVARLDRAAFALLPPGTREDLAAACLTTLGQALGGGAVIKLRSQCNARPLVLTGGAPGCRVVFMLRSVRAWAISRHRSFLEPPLIVASVLRQAIDALDKLMFCGADFSLLWFETLLADPAAALSVCAPGAACPPDILRAVMLQDSQAGTGISREVVAATPAQSGFWDEFTRDWADARLGAEWNARTEGLLAEMWEHQPS